MVDDFHSDMQGSLIGIAEDLDLLKQDPTDKPVIDRMFRRIHVLYGILGLEAPSLVPSLTRLAFAMREPFYLLRDNEAQFNDELEQLLQECLSVLTRFTNVADNVESAKKAEAILAPRISTLTQNLEAFYLSIVGE